mmetsp:Transcript_1895/g.4301  ORF Transcript_1895/g.4301 Transcript_1895/m.4301 type:complete len:242 (-) Transcript_1895:311-1036(-)
MIEGTGALSLGCVALEQGVFHLDVSLLHSLAARESERISTPGFAELNGDSDSVLGLLVGALRNMSSGVGPDKERVQQSVERGNLVLVLVDARRPRQKLELLRTLSETTSTLHAHPGCWHHDPGWELHSLSADMNNSNKCIAAKTNLATGLESGRDRLALQGYLPTIRIDDEATVGIRQGPQCKTLPRPEEKLSVPLGDRSVRARANAQGSRLAANHDRAVARLDRVRLLPARHTAYEHHLV